MATDGATGLDPGREWQSPRSGAIARLKRLLIPPLAAIAHLKGAHSVV